MSLLPLAVSATLMVPPDAWAIMTIWQEARGEPYEGKVAVAKVIRHRMRLLYNSDGTVHGTVLRPKQFSGWNTFPWGTPQALLRIKGAALRVDDQSALDCAKAWFESENGPDPTNGAVLYHADYVTPDWAARSHFLKRIGRHLFYREKERP